MYELKHFGMVWQRRNRERCCGANRELISSSKVLEAKFLGVIGTTASEFSSLLFTTFPNGFTPLPPTRAKSLKLVCNVIFYILYGNLKSENSQDYVQKPQRNCMFMNSASDDI
jgi:hypothetical protein